MKQILKKFIVTAALMQLFLFIFIPLAKASDVPFNTNGWDIIPSKISTGVSDNEHVYYGGHNSGAGPYSGFAARVDTASGTSYSSMPEVNGVVKVIIPVGNTGTVFIGGNFTTVGGLPRNNIAKINRDGTVSSWDANADGTVTDMAYISGNIFVIGEFNNIGSISSPKLAKLDTTNGTAAASWAPAFAENSYLYVIRCLANDVYIGGSFSSVSGTPFENLAKIDRVTGAVTAFPVPNGTVRSLCIINTYIYIGGDFTALDSYKRQRLVRVHRNTGIVDIVWGLTLTPNASVNVMANISGTLYIGGDFTMVGGYSQQYLARINTTTSTGSLVSFPFFFSPVSAIAVNSGAIYVSGESSGQPILMKYNLSGMYSSWDVRLNGPVNTIVLTANSVFLGGEFNAVGRKDVGYITRFNKTTGILDTTWTPVLNDYVSILASSGNYLYVAGNFTTVNGQARRLLAKINKSDGSLVTEWNPQPDSYISKIYIKGNDIYVSGYFNTIGGLSRRVMAKLNNTTGAADPLWNPNPDLNADITVTENFVYAYGNFTNIGGENLAGIAKLNLTTGAAYPEWKPDVSPANYIYTLEANGNDIFIGGGFTMVGGSSKHYIAKVNNTTGAVYPDWTVTTNGAVTKISLTGDEMFLRGIFTMVNGTAAKLIAKISGDGILRNWNPYAECFQISDISISGNEAYIGGSFYPHNIRLPRAISFFRFEETTGVGLDVTAGAGFVNFNSATDTTGVSIAINTGEGTAKIDLYKYNDAPSNISGTLAYYSDYRWIIQQRGLSSSFTGQVKFKLSEIHNEVIGNPSNVKVYSRPTPGNGSFSALPTTYNAGTGEIIADVTSFSEFIFGSDEPLPVELASFTSTVNGSNVKLNWSTVTEINNSGFDIERKSVNGTEWKKVGNIAGAGNSNEVKNYSYTESGLAAGKYNYRLKQVDYNGNFEYHSLANEVIIGIPSKFMLSQNYPNPFNPVTRINYELAINSFVSLKVFDISGREVMTLVNEVKDAGYYSVQFDAKNLSSGMYFYSIKAGEFSSVKKMVLVK